MNSVLKSNLFCLAALIGITFIIISATNRYILTVNFYNVSGSYLAGNPEQESAVFESLQKWIYLSTAGYLVTKLFIISLILYTALYFVDQQVGFNRIFNVVTLSEFIFLLPAIIKILWFHCEYPSGTLAQWQNMHILSAMSLFGTVSPDWYYPLQTFNLFEIAYWFLLSFGLSKITTMDYDQSLRIVLFSYVPVLFIWICVVVFCTLMILPYSA
jgi:hypothetical protein